MKPFLKCVGGNASELQESDGEQTASATSQINDRRSKSSDANSHPVPGSQPVSASGFGPADASRYQPALPLGNQYRPRTAELRPTTDARIDLTHGRRNSNPPRYSVSNIDSDLAEHPPLCQRRTPLGLPPSRRLNTVWQDIKEGSVRNILPCKSFRMVAIKQMPPEKSLFVGFFNNTALDMKQDLMQRTGMALGVDDDGIVKVNDEAIARLELKNRAVRVVARRRRLQGRKFIECVILDSRVDPADGRCDVLYEVRWMST